MAIKHGIEMLTSLSGGNKNGKVPKIITVDNFYRWRIKCRIRYEDHALYLVEGNKVGGGDDKGNGQS